MNDKEIDLFDLIVEVALRWRIIIVCTLIGCAVLGGVGFLKSYKQNQLQVSDVIEMQESELREGITEEQLINIETILKWEDKLETFEDYASNSAILDIDSNNVLKCETLYCIQYNDADNTAQLAQMYMDLIESGEMSNRISKRIGIPYEDVSKIVRVWQKTSDDKTLYADIFHVDVLGGTENVCEKIASEIDSFLEEVYSDISEKVVKHQVQILHRATTVVTDLTLRDEQQAFSDKETSLLRDIINAKKMLTPQEVNYYEYIKNGPKVEETSTNENVQVQKTQVNYVYSAIGAFFGLFMCVFVIATKYILGDRLHISDDMQTIYAVPTIACVAPSNKKRSVFNFIDKCIISARNRKLHCESLEKSIELMATAIRISAAKAGADKVLCVGTDKVQDGADICKQLEEILSKSNVKIEAVKSITCSSETMERVMAAQAVVLMEAVGKVTHSEIKRDVQDIQRNDINILGFALFQ